MSSDDTVPAEYPYLWSSSSQLPLEEFLSKYKPSMVQDDGAKPWLWVEKSPSDAQNPNVVAAVEEATSLLKDVTVRIEEIKNDDSIPLRANKKKGTKSKKEVREAVQSEATEKLKDISIRSEFVSGKWLIFAPSDKVDLVWSTIATSLISGPLASTRARLAKVATCPKHEVPNYSHVLCLYVPNVYDKEDVTEIMKILLRNHGMNLMGVKSNLYTAIGLDSKHPSGVPSTVWKNSALMLETEIKRMKEEYFTELNTTKANQAEKAAAEKAATGTETKTKPRLKKNKAKDDDPFASDDDESKGANVVAKENPKAHSTSTSGKSTTKAVNGSTRDDFASDDDTEKDSDEQARKAQVAAKKATSKGKTATGGKSKRPKEDDDEEEVEDRPKRKQMRK